MLPIDYVPIQKGKRGLAGLPQELKTLVEDINRYAQAFDTVPLQLKACERHEKHDSLETHHECERQAMPDAC